MSNDLNVEQCFPVPWGVIQAKCWGKPTGKPFIGLHGWLDNANTFDRLAPLLPDDIYLVAIDFPGHGRSSCRPKGVPYNTVNWVTDVKFVVSQLGWKRFSFIGHSLGAFVAALYSGTFPNEVETCILIELRSERTEEDSVPQQLAGGAQFLASNSGEDEKLYKVYKDIPAVVSAVMRANPEISKESAQILIQRRIMEVDPTENGVRIKRDRRLIHRNGKQYLGSTEVMTVKKVNAFLNEIACNIMFITGKYCHLQFRGSNQLTRETIDILKMASSYFEQLEIPANHFVHLNNPELIAKGIEDFLRKCNIKSKL